MECRLQSPYLGGPAVGMVSVAGPLVVCAALVRVPRGSDGDMVLKIIPLKFS